LPSTSVPDLARELLDSCLRGVAWRAEALQSLVAAAAGPDALEAGEGSRALFGILIEGMADLFEPRLCETYAALFCQVMEQARPELRAVELESRYRRIRRPPPIPNDVRRVNVLSRVTLGADVSVTSVLLDAVARRFPQAEIHYVGSRKGWELFAADPRIRHTPAPYARTGTLRERLAAGVALRDVLSGEGSIVVDPDSRLTQLGLLPVCEEERYFFFESRSYGGDSHDPLPVLAAAWAGQTFGIKDAKPYVAPFPSPCPPADVTVSLGVGENPAKRVADPFEPRLIRLLASSGRTVLIDKGGSDGEAARVESAIAQSGAQRDRIQTWQGPFAPFAAAIAGSRSYVGYDSAGQHLAAAAGVPLVTVFAGFPSERMFQRWRPHGSGKIEIVRADNPNPEQVLERTAAAVKRILP
jgi:ADP-heptose:LPS heptosyltransferase